MIFCVNSVSTKPDAGGLQCAASGGGAGHGKGQSLNPKPQPLNPKSLNPKP